VSEVAISVIVPCFNGASFLGRTIESVLSQTLRPLEIIVVDDGSTDNSASIAEGFGAPVRVIRQANQGESIARNRAMSEMRGTHVLFLDADDLLGLESLERLRDAVVRVPGAVGLMGVAWFTENPDVLTHVTRPTARAFLPNVIDSNISPIHSWLAPVDLLRRAGGFAGHLHWFEDWDMWWRVALLEPEIVPVDYVGALYRQHARSQLATTKMADRTRGHAVLMERMATAFLQKPALVERYGDPLFWNCWTALNRAHRYQVPWRELCGLAERLQQVLRLGPADISRSRTGRLISLLGPRAAVVVNSFVSSNEIVPVGAN